MNKEISKNNIYKMRNKQKNLIIIHEKIMEVGGIFLVLAIFSNIMFKFSKIFNLIEFISVLLFNICLFIVIVLMFIDTLFEKQRLLAEKQYTIDYNEELD